MQREASVPFCPARRKAEDLNHVLLPPKDTRLRITYYRFTKILKSYEIIGPDPREKNAGKRNKEVPEYDFSKLPNKTQ